MSESSPLRQGWGGLTLYLDPPTPRADLRQIMLRMAVPSFAYYLMLAMAAVIATLGLIADSAAVIIGAMIIAPLMGPIMGLAFGTVTGERDVILLSALTVLTGVVTVIAIAYGLSHVLGLALVGSEILARSEPTLIDLGVALAAGLAAAFAYTRASILNAVAGVAIAVALVPPLAVTGIGLELGSKADAAALLTVDQFGNDLIATNLPRGAFLLFATNLIGIVLIAVAVFASQRYGRWALTGIGMVAATVLCAIVIPDLRQSFNRLYIKSHIVVATEELAVSRPDLVTRRGKIEKFVTDFDGDTIVLRFDLIMPLDQRDDTPRRVQELHRYFADRLARPVRLEFDVLYADIVDYAAGEGVTTTPLTVPGTRPARLARASRVERRQGTAGPALPRGLAGSDQRALKRAPGRHHARLCCCAVSAGAIARRAQAQQGGLDIGIGARIGALDTCGPKIERRAQRALIAAGQNMVQFTPGIGFGSEERAVPGLHAPAQDRDETACENRGHHRERDERCSGDSQQTPNARRGARGRRSVDRDRHQFELRGLHPLVVDVIPVDRQCGQRAAAASFGDIGGALAARTAELAAIVMLSHDRLVRIGGKPADLDL